MAIQNINELYDQLSSNENFSSFNFGTADEFKSYLQELPEDKKEKFYNAWLDDQDISKEQFDSLLKKKEQGRTGILSSALGSIDLGSPSGSKITEPQTVTPEVKAPEVTPIAETTTAPPIAEEEMGIEDFSVSGVEGGPLDGGPGKPKPKVFKPDFRTKSQIAAELGTQKEAERTPVKQTPEVIKKVREKAIEVKKAVEKEQTENPFKNAGFEFEVATGREIMDESGTRKEFQTVTKQPTDAEIGEVLLKNTQIPLANGVDVGRIFGRPTYVFDRETYTSYLERKGFSPEKINELQNYYIDQYIKANSEQDVETKLGRVEGKDINEKLTKIRQQEDEKGLNLLAGQYGIDVADKARELQSFMAKRKRPGEAGYDQWNRQMQTLQKEMSTLVGGGERLYNPEDGKLYDAETAPKRAVAFKVALDKAIKLYGNTDIDKLKQIRSTLYDQVEFLEKEYDRMVGPQWRGKEFLKGLSGTITEEQKEGLIQTFSRLDNLKAQLSAVNARILTNTDIEPTTTEKTGQFLKQLRAGLPGGDFASKYQTLKDDYNAYVQGIEGEIKLKEGEAEKGELTFGEQLVGGLGSTIPIMAELALTRKITPSAAFLRGSGYLRPITRGVLKTTGSTKFANFMTDAIANAVQGYTSYGLTSETGATGVGETLFSQTIWDKIGLEKMGAKWAPVLRYLSKTALGTTGETIEEFVGEFSNNLSETGFDWSKSAEETFGKDISDFGKKLALYASTSALLSGLYNAPELAIKSLRIDEVISEAENKLNDPNLSQADKEAIKSSVEMMKKTRDQLSKKETEIAEPISTILPFNRPTEEMEAPGGVTPPVAEGAETAAFEAGEGPLEPTQPVGAQPVNVQEVNNQLAKEGINDVSLQRVEEYGKEIESGNADFERFSPSEQRGLIEGGPVHVEATIITGKSDRAADTQDDSNDRQEDVVKEYAQKKGIWLDNAPAKLTEKYGDPFQSGKESLVWLDEARGVVVKSSVTDQYPTLREALDSITLSNAYFPAAKITVVGFGTNEKGEFEIITEQPYIQGVNPTEQEIKEHFNKLGFTENERMYQGKDAFGNEEVIFKDAAPKNVIKTPEGNIVPIDLIAKINKPELNANGTRTLPSTVAEEVTEAAPEAVGPQKDIEAKKADIEKRRQEELESSDVLDIDKETIEAKTLNAVESLFEKYKNSPLIKQYVEESKRTNNPIDDRAYARIVETYFNELPEDVRNYLEFEAPAIDFETPQGFSPNYKGFGYNRPKETGHKEGVHGSHITTLRENVFQQNSEKADKIDLAEDINAKYDAELAALEAAPEAVGAQPEVTEEAAKPVEARPETVQQFEQKAKQVASTKENTAFVQNSVVKNADGTPLVVYNNTNESEARFTEGRPTGLFFTTNAEAFSDYGKTKFAAILNLKNPYYSSMSAVRSAADIQKLKDAGYDGVITHPSYKYDKYVSTLQDEVAAQEDYIKNQDKFNNVEGRDNRNELDLTKAYEFIAFNPEQIKIVESADNKSLSATEQVTEQAPEVSQEQQIDSLRNVSETQESKEAIAKTKESLDKVDREKFENLKNTIIFENGKFEKEPTATEGEPSVQQVSARPIQENKNEFIKAIANISRRILKEKTVKGTLLTKADGKAIKEFAEKNGFYYPSYEGITKGREAKKPGVESLVYVTEDGKSVIKINNGVYNETWGDFFNRIAAHNIYFPETSYEFLGFTERDGRLAAIVKQPLVDIERGATPNEVKQDLEKRGLEFKSIYNVTDNVNDVKLRDFHNENAVVDKSGDIVYIDPIIEVKNDDVFSNYIAGFYNAVKPENSNPSLIKAVEQEIGVQPEISGEYGSQNKIVTKQDYDQAVKNLRNPNLPSGFDFSKIGDLVKAAMYHIEAGSRKFADFTKKMVEQFGRGVRQYLPNVFRRANNQLQQEQAAAPTAAPTPAPTAPVDTKTEIKKAYDEIIAPDPNISEDKIGQELINRGYTLGQIKRFVPQLRNFYVKQAEKTFMDYVEQFQGKYDQRRAEIEKFMESNPSLDYPQVYEQLKDQYSDFELFKMFYEDGADADLLAELFGLEYKKTIQDAIESKNYNPDFLRDLDKDITSRKLKKNLSESRSLFSELQNFASAGQLMSAAAEVLGLSGIEEAMKTMTDKMRAENEQKMEMLKAYGRLIDGTITEEEAARVADMLSFSGRMLRMGRGLFMTEKGLVDLIIKGLETVETKSQDYFTKKKRILRVSEGTRAKIEKQVKEFFLRKKQFEEAVAAVDTGIDAVTEEAFDNFNVFENAFKKASTNLQATINRLYGSRSPMFSKWYIANTAQGVLRFATSSMGLITNTENNLALAPRKNLVAKVLGWTRVLADYINKLAVYAKKGQTPTAYEALKKGGGVGIDPSLYRSLAFEKGMREIADILYKGVTETTSSEKDFLKGYGEIDGVKDMGMAFRMTKAVLRQFVPFGKKLEKLTEEEFAAAFDKMLVALDEKDANGKPKLALLHSKGYDTVTTFLRGFFGTIPTITGRAIALSGDRVFYQLGYYEFLTAYANSKGITDPKEVQQFLLLNSVPNGDNEMLQKIAEESGNRRIFANDNAVVRVMGGVEKFFEKIEKSIFAKKIQRISEGKRTKGIAESQAKYILPTAGKIAANMVILFKRIPPNVIARYVRITSGFSFVLAIRNQVILSARMKEYEDNFGPQKNPKLSETKKKQMEKERVLLFEQMRKTERFWTEFLQGLQLAALVYLVIESGAVSPPYGEDEEDKKRARAAGIAQQDASRLNISQLVRYVKGESKRGFTNQKGDISFDYRNLGILGFALGAYSSVEAMYKINKFKQKSILGNQDESTFKVGMHMIAQSLTNGVTQLSFIQTVTSAISAFRGNGEKAGKDFATSLLSTALTVPTLSYGAFSGIEKSQGISADPFRNYNPELEDQKDGGFLSNVLSSEIAARVWTKLTAKSPLYGFGLRDKEGNFIAPLNAIGFTPSKFYRPQIGPHGERLYKKNTFWDTRSGSFKDKFNAFLQATIDPFSFSDYEGFVSSVKPFEKSQEYTKGDFVEWNNNVWVVVKDKLKGVSPRDAKLGEDGDYILVDEKSKFIDPDQFRADQDGTYRTQLLFNFVELYEKATGDTKNYDILSKLYKDPVKFKDAEGTMTVYIPMEEQRKLALMRGEAMRRSWETEDLENLTEAIKKASENENIPDEDFKKYVKELFDNYILGPLDNNNNRTDGVIDKINENINAIENSPEYIKIMQDGLIKTIQEGNLSKEQFDRLNAIPEAASFISGLDEKKLKFKK